MKRMIFYFLIFIQLLWAQSFQNKDFRFVKTIPIDSSIIISGNNEFEISENGQILIADMQGYRAYLLKNNGKIIKRLNPDGCNTGMKMAIVNAHFTKYNEIVILGGNPWGYRFDSRGNCIGNVNVNFSGANMVCSTKNGLVTLRDYDFGPDDKANISLHDKNFRLIKKFGDFPEENKHVYERYPYAGFCVDQQDNIYYQNPLTYKIDKYNSSGKKLSIIKNKPSFFINFPVVKKMSDPFLQIRESAKLLKTHYIVQGLFVLNETCLISFYSKPGILAYQINSKMGTAISEYKYSKLPCCVFVKDQKMYLLVDKNIDENDFENFVIEVYEYKY